MEINRRNFIRTLGLAGGSILLFPACNTVVSEWRFFTDEEAKLVIALAEQIIPTDDAPGATDAGVVHFIDKQLAGFYNNYGAQYREALQELQRYCQRTFKTRFEELEWDQQTAVLEDMENNNIDGVYWKKEPASGFFYILCEHSMQGFYGSPRHGGNKNHMSYKMLKLDYPHVIGQNRYGQRSETLNVFKNEK
jgi:gluconate 2-dehydrogenase gamma chain